jgi:hypothetical protein
MTLAVLIAAATAVPSLLEVHGQSELLMLYTVLERSVMIITLILLATLQFLIVHYRLQLPKNTLIYSFTYAVYFTSRALQTVVLSAFGTTFSEIGNAIAMSVDVACLVVWGCFLSRAGVRTQVTPGKRLSVAEQLRLRAQLAGFNDMIGRLRQR